MLRTRQVLQAPHTHPVADHTLHSAGVLPSSPYGVHCHRHCCTNTPTPFNYGLRSISVQSCLLLDVHLEVDLGRLWPVTTHTATFVVATSVRAKTCVAVVFGGASSPLGTLFSVVFDLAIDVGLPVHLNHLLGLLRRCHICAGQNTFRYIAQGVHKGNTFQRVCVTSLLPSSLLLSLQFSQFCSPSSRCCWLKLNIR